MLYYLLALGSVFLIWISLIIFFKFKYKKKLSSSKIDFFNRKIKFISKSSFSKREKILEYDKFYHNILKEVWYNWTFWDILKLKPSIINDLNKIWELHKIRNKLAHDISDISDTFLSKKAREFEKELYILLDNLK